MRHVVVFAVLGLALGLAAQKLPRVLGQGDAFDLMSEDRLTQASAEAAPASSSAVRVAALSPPAASADQSPPGEPIVATRAAAVEGKPDAPGTAIAPDVDLNLEAVERLMAAGFEARRAREIVLREGELRNEAIKAEYAATGTIQPLNAAARAVAGQRLRKEIGDEVYEKYLEATRRPTRVRVGDVEAGSAAANAGILSGDEIVSYAGRRVFDAGELNAMMLQTSIGETIATTVVRDGQRLTLYVTGGPLGISQRAFR